MDMRKLSVHAAGDDILSLLKALSECHSSASKIIQVFLNSRDLLDVGEIQEKFQELIRCLFAFTRICAFVSEKYSELACSDKFLVDEINAKSNDILCSLNKRKCKKTDEKRNEIKVREKLNVDYKKQRDNRNNGSKSTPKNTVYIPLKKFKNLAIQVFGPRVQTGKVTKGDDTNLSEVSSRQATTNKRKKAVKFGNDESSKCNSANKNDMIFLNHTREMDELSSNAVFISRETQNDMENYNIEGFPKKLGLAIEKEMVKIFQNVMDNFPVLHLQHEYLTRQTLDEKKLSCYKEYETENLTRHAHVSETVEVVQYKKVNEKELKAHSDFENESIGAIQADFDQENAHSTEIQKAESELGQPWDVIGRIANQLIEESIQSLSRELDSVLDKNVIDLEFQYADTENCNIACI